MTLARCAAQVGAAFEESFLFSDTIAANIAYGRPDATREEVEQARRVAGAHGFICELPDGFDTRVGERGLSLSGGQRQRVALARAVLTDPRILLLDDATSAVDATHRGAIFVGLREVLAGRTALLVAHRVSTLSLADRVVAARRRPGGRRGHPRGAAGPQRGLPRAPRPAWTTRPPPRSATRSRRLPRST